jgi:hypothetical protein
MAEKLPVTKSTLNRCYLTLTANFVMDMELLPIA